MKHLKSSLRDLHYIFRTSITAREIAEPLFSLDSNISSEKAHDLLDKRGYDAAGIRNDGELEGYVLTHELTNGKAIDHLHKFDTSDLLSASDSMLDTFEALKDSPWVFIQFLGVPSGIVTRGDLQKAPVRMWLFGLISLLEMQMLRSIRAAGQTDDWWIALLSENRIAAARRVFTERQKRNEEIGMSDCLQLGDKATIFKKNDSLFVSTGCTSKNEWKKMMDQIEPLRNDLAHSSPLESKTWPEIASCVTWLERVLANLEYSDDTITS